MGNKPSNIKYDLRIIFYGNTPQAVAERITANNLISNINNEYFLYEKYNWYIFLRIMNRNISSANDIEIIINNKMPNRNGLIFRKNVVVCFVQLDGAINLLQNYQEQFFFNNNIEDNMPYFIFDTNSLNVNNQHVLDLKILFNEEKEVINISAVNQNLQLYQTDFYFDDFLKSRIFRNFNNLGEIYSKLQQLKERNEYMIEINNNTEKLEITFHINQQPNDREDEKYLGSDAEKKKKENNNKKMEKLSTPLCSSKKNQNNKKKSNIKIKSDDYDCTLIVEQNIFIHVSIVDLLEDERSVVTALLDAANYYNYLPLKIDNNRDCYNSFNIMLAGQSQSGKSVLMNKIAGQNITYSAQGRLRTEDIFVRDIYKGKISIYDTCGASNYFRPKDIFSKLDKTIRSLENNGEKIDLLLIVIKRGNIPDEFIFKDLIIKLIQLNLNYLIVINYFERVDNSYKAIIKETFLANECEIDDSNIVEVNILKDISPLFYKIFEKFRNSRITSNTFINENLKRIINLSRYSLNNNLLLYRDISFNNIFKRKIWEAEKLYWKYLTPIIGSNFIPIANILVPLVLTLKLISDLHRIFLGRPIFNLNFFSHLRRSNISTSQVKRMLKFLAIKTGIRVFVKLAVKFGGKSSIKLSTLFFDIFPGVGTLINGVIGNIIDIPTFNKAFNEAKEEFCEKLKMRPNSATRRIVQGYNDAINYFGKRADLDIDHNNYIIPDEEMNNDDINIIDELNNLDLNELLIDNNQENNV